MKRLYLDQLRIANRVVQEPISPRAEELVLSQKIVEAVHHVYRTQPERAAVFADKLAFYERWLARLSISDEHLVMFPNREKLVGHSILWALIGIIGAPIALYGWMHRAMPYALVKWAVRKFTAPGRRKAQTSTAAIEAGIVAFGLCYSLFIFIFHLLFGWPASLWYALSLPPASLLAHYYLREMRRFSAAIRNTFILLRAPMASRRLLSRRDELIKEIERVRRELMPETRVTSSQH